MDRFIASACREPFEVGIERGQAASERFAAFGQLGHMIHLGLLARIEFAVESGQPGIERSQRFGFGCGHFVAAAGKLAFERCRAADDRLVEAGTGIGQRIHALAGVADCCFVDLADLADRGSHPLLQIVYRPRPALARIVLSRAQPFDQALAFGSQFGKAGLELANRRILVLLAGSAEAGKLHRQLFRTAANGRQRIGFAGFQFEPERFVLLAQGRETLLRRAVEIVDPGREGVDRLGYPLAQAIHLAPARLAELVESLEGGDHVLHLALRGVAGMADLVGDIARGVGNDRQLIAQTVHVGEGAVADLADGLHLLPVVADELLQLGGILRQAFGRNPPQRFQIARLRGDELPRQAELPVYHRQPLFQRLRFGGQQPGRFSKAGGIAGGMARGKQPDEHDQHHRQSPLPDEGDALLRRYPAGGQRPVGPGKEAAPCANGQDGKGRQDPASIARRGFGFIPLRGKGVVGIVSHRGLHGLGDRRVRLVAIPAGGIESYKGFAPGHRAQDNSRRVRFKPALTAIGHDARMMLDQVDFEANLAAAAGDDPALRAELVACFRASLDAQRNLLSRARCDGNWEVSAMRLRGLGASFHSGTLVALAEEALDTAPGDPVVLRKLAQYSQSLAAEG